MRRVSIFCSFVMISVVACSEEKEDAVAYISALQVVEPDGRFTDLLAPGDAGAAVHSAFVSVRAAFTTLLDPNKIQDLSGAIAQPGKGVAKALWQRPQGVVELPLLAVYNPARTALGAPAPIVTFRSTGGFPADAALTIELDPTRLTNKRGQPYVGPTRGSFQTAPFEVFVSIPAGPLGGSFVPRLSFTNVPSQIAPDAVQVLDARGQPVAIKVQADSGQVTGWIVSPQGEGVPWPPGAYTLSLNDSQVSDGFGVSLAPGPRAWPFQVGGVAVDASTDASED